ncbi:hypothetical protein L195_g023566 [Trifolium pratense]|uniref:Uncharacterized protein n=1 Tax=Trifolium pratense TaxID=57577 RepID=A0A2K3NBA3_TRIPR|nr:hypothetical protein L195_g023566 [Trifolium pratense]
MTVYAYEDINTVLGTRFQKSILTTIHVKDVPFGEIDPVFAYMYSDELDAQWKVYAGNHLHLLTWNQCLQQPLISKGWTELRELLQLKYQFHKMDLVYYGDNIFQLLLPLTEPCPTNEFPSFHSLSTKLPEPFTFEIVLASPVAEPHLAEIIQTPAGDVLKFSFFDIAKSNRVDVDIDRIVN